MRRTTYTVSATREDGWWVIEVPQVRGAYSQTRRLDQVEDMARDVIATMLDVPEDAFDLEIMPQLGSELDPVVAAAVRARANVDNAQAVARDATALAAQRLRGEGLPVRDIGRLLGVSYQRAAKIGR